MSTYCEIHGYDVHKYGECPILSDVEAALHHALGWRAKLLPTKRMAESVRTAFDAVIAENFRKNVERKQEAARATLEKEYEDKNYAASQAKDRADQEIAQTYRRARAEVEDAKSEMRHVIIGFVQALIDKHLPHEQVSEAAHRVTNGQIVVDAFAMDTADQLLDTIQVVQED
jgi:hypothetical protein